MYKDYNMIHLTLPMAISVLTPIHDISRHVNDIVETNTKTEFICPNNKRLVFKNIPITMINMALNEILNYMNVMMIQNVL